MRSAARILGLFAVCLSGASSFGQGTPEEARTLCDPSDPRNRCPGADCACVEDTLEVVFDGDSQSVLEYDEFVAGSPVDVTVITETTAVGRQGWSYGLAHDESFLTLTSAGIAGTTAEGLLDVGFDVTHTDNVQTCLTDRCDKTDPAQRRDGGGWISAVVLSFIRPITLPIARNSVAKAQYTIDRDVGEEGTLIRFTDQLALKNSPPADINLTIDGKSRTWTTAIEGRIRRKAEEKERLLCDVDDPANNCPGANCVCLPDTLEITFDGDSQSILEYDAFVQDGPIDVTLVMDTRTDGVQGWSYDVEHDVEDLTVVSATIDGTDAKALMDTGFDATSAEDIQTCLTDACSKSDPAERRDGGGWISALVLSFTKPVVLPLERSTIARATYTISRDVGEGGTLLQVSERLAKRNSPRFDMTLTVVGKSRRWTTTIDGWVKRMSGPEPATPFLRGDVGVGKPGDEHPADGKLDVTDAVRILRTLFLGSDLDFYCRKAVDADDSGEIVLSDVVYLLNYLFLGQTAPLAPFPDVGQDATPDDLSCVEYP